MLNRILLGLGGTEYTLPAIGHAVDIALRHQATITGITIVDTRQPGQTRVASAAAHQGDAVHAEDPIATEQHHVARSIEDFERACSSAGVDYQVLPEHRNVLDVLIETSRYHDLTVFGLKSLFEYETPGDPENAVLRLIAGGVRPILAVAREYRDIRRVLIAYSGSMESAKAMKRFVQLRLWPDVRLRIVTFNASEPDAAKLARDAAEYCRAHGYAVDWQTDPGSAKLLLLAAAQLGQDDLIVMGSSARNVLLRRMFGDTAQSMIHDSDRPLFLCQ